MAIELYNEALQFESPMHGIINNNLGISHFFKFVELSEKIKNPLEMSPDTIIPIVENANLAIKNLKKSVVQLEQFDLRL
jgi:hypothetical protein